MSVFTSALSGTCADVDTWHYVSYDQLSQDLLPEKKDVGLIFIETSWKASQLPYHKQKLALLLSNQRHFALEMQDAGYPVRYVFSENEYGEVLSELCEELGEITVTKPAELSLRRSIQPLVESVIGCWSTKAGLLQLRISSKEQVRMLRGEWTNSTVTFARITRSCWRMTANQLAENGHLMMRTDYHGMVLDLPETLRFEPTR